MTHFGKPKVGGKFYYGDPRDTPWNRDLLWVKFVNKEETDMTRPLDERAGRTGTQVAEVVRPKTKSRRGGPSRGGTASASAASASSREIRAADEEVRRVEKQIEEVIEDEKRRRKIFEASLSALETRLKAAKAKQVAAIEKKLKALKQTPTSFSVE